MAQRRPLTDHPAFVALLVLWFAALFGSMVAVLPNAVLERGLAATGANTLLPLTSASRAAASVVAALAGALLGLVLALPIARRGRSDPRPTYAEPEAATGDPVSEEPVRRPLRVREELASDFHDPAPARESVPDDAASDGLDREGLEREGVEEAPMPTHRSADFMILAPRPADPHRQTVDLDALLAQFDTALATFRASDEAKETISKGAPDPVHEFVARQTGAAMPDHRGELRAVLDKLSRETEDD